MHHPDMILKEEDFVVKKINWDDKVKNISEIATELNLGLDSFIFIDDSDFEIGMVKQELPQVKCIQVPTNASDYPAVIRGLVKEFDLSRLTAEDRQKTKMYQQDKHRNSVSSQFDSVDDYLSSLNMNVNVLWGADIPVSRASQLSQKTNQFNLTTRRYSESDIQRMLDDDTYALATFSVTDQYGDYGITGLIIIKLNLGSESYAIIDSFLMSCRIIGRNVEYAVFYQIIKKLNDLGVNKLKAEYLTTPKSKLVEKFYDALGLKNVFSDDACKKYTINLNGYKSSGIGYIKTISEG
jgi:FkbH-like protein